MLSVISLSSWMQYIITKYWEFYILNNPQIFYTSPYPASLLRSNYLFLIGTTTIASVIVHQHSLSCQHVLIMPFLHTTAKWPFQNIMWSCQHRHNWAFLWLSIAVMDENMTPFKALKSQQSVAPTFFSSFICTIFPLALSTPSVPSSHHITLSHNILSEKWSSSPP